MHDFTLHDLQCFDAVVDAGGFQAAAQRLHRSHPAVFAAVARLERQLGLVLLERGGYRVGLTAAGRSFHQRAQALLYELEGLRGHAAHLAQGEESELRVVLRRARPWRCSQGSSAASRRPACNCCSKPSAARWSACWTARPT